MKKYGLLYWEFPDSTPLVGVLSASFFIMSISAWFGVFAKTITMPVSSLTITRASLLSEDEILALAGKFSRTLAVSAVSPVPTSLVLLSLSPMGLHDFFDKGLSTD